MLKPHEHMGVLWINKCCGMDSLQAMAVADLLASYEIDPKVEYKRTDPAAEARGLREALAILEGEGLDVPVMGAVLSKLDKLAGKMQPADVAETVADLTEYSDGEICTDKSAAIEQDAEGSSAGFQSMGG